MDNPQSHAHRQARWLLTQYQTKGPLEFVIETAMPNDFLDDPKVDADAYIRRHAEEHLSLFSPPGAWRMGEITRIPLEDDQSRVKVRFHPVNVSECVQEAERILDGTNKEAVRL